MVNLLPPSVYIGCAPEDWQTWGPKIRNHLSNLKNSGISYWTEEDIQAGEHKEEVPQAMLASVKVSVLLVSSRYIASDLMLARMHMLVERHTKVIWLHLSATDVKDLPFEKIEPLFRDPLKGMNEADQDVCFVQLANLIRREAGSNLLGEKYPPPEPPPRHKLRAIYVAPSILILLVVLSIGLVLWPPPDQLNISIEKDPTGGIYTLNLSDVIKSCQKECYLLGKGEPKSCIGRISVREEELRHKETKISCNGRLYKGKWNREELILRR